MYMLEKTNDKNYEMNLSIGYSSLDKYASISKKPLNLAWSDGVRPLLSGELGFEVNNAKNFTISKCPWRAA